VTGTDRHTLRVGELSRRAGVSPDLLRAWERRYGLLQPVRTAGGFRLYSPEDERRVQLMQQHLGRGLSAAEAARLALAPVERSDEGAPLEAAAGDLRAALDAFAEAEAQLAYDRLAASFSLETVLGRVLLPYLRELGERWEEGEATVGQEHFASNLLRARLLGAARGWDRGEGPRALLACAPGELHDLPLIVFGLALRRHGWRITFLGPDTPLATLAETAAEADPDLVVVCATIAEHLERHPRELASLAQARPLAIAGAGASPELASQLGCELLRGDPLTAAAGVAGGRLRSRQRRADTRPGAADQPA
jgi:MerR family transcriptional regulator, light-induced transcriptional regulator